MYKNLGRWPIHPAPYIDESLSSWIIRISRMYCIYPVDFFKYELNIKFEINDLYIADINPPISLIDKLSQRTGVDINKVRALTAHSYVPLLIDTVEPVSRGSKANPNLFNNYINQFHIFPRKILSFIIPTTGIVTHNKWAPWIDSKRFTNTFGCESCLRTDKEPYLRLYWRFPWMMTCPLHKELLKQIKLYGFTKKIEFESIKYTKKFTTPLDNLYLIDKITLQAVTKGFVKTPAGYLHGGVWLRLLRSLIEELSLLQNDFSKEVINSVKSFWRKLGLFYREGFGKYKVFEECENNKQLILMLVTALVLKSIFNNEIKFSTNGIKLLTPKILNKNDLNSIYSKYIIKSNSSSSKTIITLVNDMITSMHKDSKEVENFRNIIRSFDQSGKSLSIIDSCLRDLGIEIKEDSI